MFKFKKMKYLVLMLCLGLLCFGVPQASAQARYSQRTSEPITTPGNIAIDDAGATMDYEVWVYGITIYADAASARALIKNCDTTTELFDHSTYKPDDELGEPTQYEVTTIMYDTPRVFTEGVGAAVSVGTVFIIYGPSPN